jgi:dUTP pyrophosphatase
MLRTMPDVPVTVLPHFAGLELPSYATAGAAGVDLVAAVSATVLLPSLGRALIPTGLTVAIPPGWEGQVRPRSGLALKQGLTVLNAPGTIDSDYRGEIQVLLVNLGASAVTIERGMRVAQLVLARCEQLTWRPVPALDASGRGSGGFGSTGTGAKASSAQPAG